MIVLINTMRIKILIISLFLLCVDGIAQQQSGGGRSTTSVTLSGIGNQSTNIIGIGNQNTNTINIGTNSPTTPLNVTGQVSIVNASQETIGISNLNIAVIQVTTTNNAESAAGDVLFQQLTLTDAVRTNKHATINSITLQSHTNLTILNTKLIFTKAPITWPANSAVANIIPAEGTNILGTYTLSTTNCYYAVLGTNSTWTTFPMNLGICTTGTATSVYMYGITGNAITNDATGIDTWSITVTKD